MSQDEFTKLFRYLQKELADMHGEIKAVNDNVNNLTTIVDAYARKLDGHSQELTMLSHRVDRHEGWINQISVKTGVQLSN